MDKSKKALTSASALNPIDYDSEGKIILSIDPKISRMGGNLIAGGAKNREMTSSML